MKHRLREFGSAPQNLVTIPICSIITPGRRSRVTNARSQARTAPAEAGKNPNPVEGRAQGAAGGARPVAPFISMSYIGANPRNIILVRSRLNGAPVHLSHARNVQGLCWRQEGAG